MPATAATFCVGTVAELRAALQSAQAVGDDEIRIRTGTYLVDATLVYSTQNPGWLVITGGHFDAGGVPCGGRTNNAGATELDGEGMRQVMILSYQPGNISTNGARFYVENLTFKNGVGTGFQRGGGLNIALGGTSAINEIWLENLIVRNNSGYFAGGIQTSVENGFIRVVNSLFDSNSAPDSVFGHLALNVFSSPPAYGNAIVVANSTFARGRCLGNTGGPRGCGILIFGGTGVNAAVVNTVFHDNDITDLNTQIIDPNGTERVIVRDSLMPVAMGTLPRTIERPLSGDPGFVNASVGDFLPTEDSPLINRGVLPLPGIFPQFNGFDVSGGLRNRFGAIDVGALERQTLDPVFRDGFEPATP